jgi:antitoxin (DNA-binding transcriptional repressor) of toxin-antitoxin stability system
MKTTTAREFRSRFSKLARQGDTVLVTRRGRPAGVFYPIPDAQRLPMSVRRELFFEFSQDLSRALKQRGITEKDVLRDFETFKRRRRR